MNVNIWMQGIGKIIVVGVHTSVIRMQKRTHEHLAIPRSNRVLAMFYPFSEIASLAGLLEIAIAML